MVNVTSHASGHNPHVGGDRSGLRTLLDKIKRQTGIDFRRYQSDVLQRRVRHRLNLMGCATYWDYILLLNRDPHEYDRLTETLTIKVSSFFRDPECFVFIKSVVLPEILEATQLRRGHRIRIWTCGTAFGQEAYTVGILMNEVLGSSLCDFDVRILATDIDKAALDQARWGSYESDTLEGIGCHLLFKYFTRAGGRYVVNDRVRNMVVFKYHDVTSDLRLSGMDLVICKNLLIYFGNELREKALANLSDALNPGGFLVLGKTERLLSPVADRFEITSPRDRVYKKLRPLSRAGVPAMSREKEE